MIFRAELARKIVDGEKSVTRRLCNEKLRSPWYAGGCAFKPGRDYAVQLGRGRPAVARILVIDVRQLPLGDLTAREAKREGFDSIEDFERTWVDMHGGYDAAALVWRIEFVVASVNLMETP